MSHTLSFDYINYKYDLSRIRITFVSHPQLYRYRSLYFYFIPIDCDILYTLLVDCTSLSILHVQHIFSFINNVPYNNVRHIFLPANKLHVVVVDFILFFLYNRNHYLLFFQIIILLFMTFH